MTLKIAIILGSTRPGRNGKQVAEWVLTQARKRKEATYELVDLADYPLPLLDEPVPAGYRQYQHNRTKRWAAKVSEFDGFVFVTPEYNHSTSAALKNALDYLSAEWANKAAAFVGYGSLGGARAIESLRLVTAELQLAGVRQGVYFQLSTDFKNYSDFSPHDRHVPLADTMFGQVEAWAGALAPLR